MASVPMDPVFVNKGGTESKWIHDDDGDDHGYDDGDDVLDDDWDSVGC